MSNVKKQKYIILTIIEVLLLYIVQVVDVRYQISQFPWANDIAFIALAIPILLILSFLRKEDLKYKTKKVITFLFYLFLVGWSLALIAGWAERLL